MLDKVSMDKIASYYYDIGITLALQDAGLVKTAEPKSQAKPKKQKMTMPAMEIKPSKTFKQINKLTGTNPFTGVTTRDSNMAHYLNSRRQNLSYDNAGLPKYGPEHDKMLERAFDDEDYAAQLSKRLKAGDPG